MEAIDTTIKRTHPNFRVELLRKLCLKHPELLMIDLADCLEISVEEVYKLIKEYHLPYYWKYNRNSRND